MNAAFTERIEGLESAESTALLEFLFGHVARSVDRQCRVRWEPQTVTIWDNRCTQHHSTWDFFPATRSGWRVSCAGRASVLRRRSSMRLARYVTPGGPSVGLVLEYRLLALGVADVAELYEREGLLERTVEAALARRDGGRNADVQPTLADVELLAPVRRPTKVIGVGMNYRSFVEQLGESVPAYPVLFHKTASALTGHGHAIEIPPITDQAVPEGELAVVIGRPGRDIEVDDAIAHVAGYCCANDVSARNLEFRTSQWTSGKMLPTFCPLGP